MSDETDIAIVGGGPVGMALALALADSDWRVIVLESRQRGAPVSDPRPLALSYGSRLLLERLAVWRTLEICSTPIERIHVSQQGGFGRVEMTAAQAALPALGYVVDYARLHAALRQALRETLDTDVLTFLLVKVTGRARDGLGRVSLTPEEIKRRFSQVLTRV